MSGGGIQSPRDTSAIGRDEGCLHGNSATRRGKATLRLRRPGGAPSPGIYLGLPPIPPTGEVKCVDSSAKVGSRCAQDDAQSAANITSQASCSPARPAPAPDPAPAPVTCSLSALGLSHITALGPAYTGRFAREGPHAQPGHRVWGLGFRLGDF